MYWTFKTLYGIVLLEIGGKTMEKPVIAYERRGPSGNIFFILAMCQKELKRQRRINDYNEMWEKVQKSGSYDEALKIIGEVVELIRVD